MEWLILSGTPGEIEDKLNDLQRDGHMIHFKGMAQLTDGLIAVTIQLG